MKRNIVAALFAVVALLTFAWMFVASADAQLHASASAPGAVPSEPVQSTYVAGP
jgi:hypothetical protein